MLPAWFLQLGLMGWPLALCSLVAVAIGLERSLFCLRSRAQKETRYQQLADYLTEHKSEKKQTRDEMIGVMLAELQRSYYSGIKELRIIGTISPLLGLLGTILGIISAFQVIAVQAGPVSPSMIADGLWEALLTTAVGLAIALPSLVLAHLFRHISEAQLEELVLRLNKLSILFELGSKKS